MTLTDYHTHSYRCGHAVGRMEEYIESAIARGIDEIGLTDHLFLYFEPAETRDDRWAIHESEYDTHYAEMLDLRNQYKDRINVRVAVEADFVAGHEDALRDVLSRYEFDFILGGVHFMDGWLIDDPDTAYRYREERVAEIYRRYFSNVQGAVATGLFDVIAHLDLPKKFGAVPEEDISDVVDETLDMIRDADICVEVSTAGLRKPVCDIYPSRPILEGMKRREIPVVLSSDAHDPRDIGSHFDESIALVTSVGYESVATFDSRVRQMVDLG